MESTRQVKSAGRAPLSHTQIVVAVAVAESTKTSSPRVPHPAPGQLPESASQPHRAEARPSPKACGTRDTPCTCDKVSVRAGVAGAVSIVSGLGIFFERPHGEMPRVPSVRRPRAPAQKYHALPRYRSAPRRRLTRPSVRAGQSNGMAKRSADALGSSLAVQQNSGSGIISRSGRTVKPKVRDTPPGRPLAAAISNPICLPRRSHGHYPSCPAPRALAAVSRLHRAPCPRAAGLGGLHRGRVCGAARSRRRQPLPAGLPGPPLWARGAQGVRGPGRRQPRRLLVSPPAPACARPPPSPADRAEPDASARPCPSPPAGTHPTTPAAFLTARSAATAPAPGSAPPRAAPATPRPAATRWAAPSPAAASSRRRRWRSSAASAGSCPPPRSPSSPSATA
jgi:hypothetical protein